MDHVTVRGSSSMSRRPMPKAPGIPLLLVAGILIVGIGAISWCFAQVMYAPPYVPRSLFPVNTVRYPGSGFPSLPPMTYNYYRGPAPFSPSVFGVAPFRWYSGQGWLIPPPSRVQQGFMNPFPPSRGLPFLPPQAYGWRQPSFGASLYLPFNPGLTYNRVSRADAGTSRDTEPLPKPEDPDEYPVPLGLQEEREEVLRRALDWIFENPAGFEYEEVEVGEEIMLFYQLLRRAGTEDARDLCRDYIRVRIQGIVEHGILDNPSPGEITVLVPMCEIMVKLGLALFDYRTFIRDKVLLKPDATLPGYAIWNSSVLERLGFYGSVPVTTLAGQGGISAELRSGTLMQLMGSPNPDPKVIMEEFYEITHEIFPLTGFGETPLSYFSPRDISALRGMLEKGIAFFLLYPDVDILGELVIAIHMLGGGDEPVVNSALEFIMGEQTGAGSFGISPRLTAMGRSSPSRHVVFVAVWALIQ